MKVNSEYLLLNKENLNYTGGVFLVSGNEETLIFSIEKILINHFNKIGFIEKEKYENIDLDSSLSFGASLFSNKKIIIYKNPKEVNFEFLEKNYDEDLVLIITHNKLKNSSKIKREFDFHKTYNSTSCYELSKDQKKKIIDRFISEEKILFDKDCYWYLVEKLPSYYGYLENELNKIKYNKEGNLSLESLKSLISGNNWDDDFDSLFFLTMGSKKDIINKTRDIIQTPNDSYILIQRIKFYFDLISNAKDIGDVEKRFPKYLFMHKSSFINMYKKMNREKISKLLKLIKRTEIIIRKNNNFYFIFSQRFLLNINNSL